MVMSKESLEIFQTQPTASCGLFHIKPCPALVALTLVSHRPTHH